MALHGFYVRHNPIFPGAPRIRALLYLGRSVSGVGPNVEVIFLIDTGADSTSLLSLDMNRLGIDFGVVTAPVEYANGVGGAARSKQVNATVSLSDEVGVFRHFEVQSRLLPDTGGFPSLLGRDILKQCRCTLDAVNRNVILELKKCPRRASISGSLSQDI